MTTVSYAKGVLVATLAAGPLLMFPLLIAGAVSMSPLEVLRQLPLVPVILIPTVVVGGMISLLPNLVGASILAYVGRSAMWARRPLLWASSGAALGGLIGSWFSDDAGNWGAILTLAGIGTACALICRWGTRWSD